MSYRVKMPTTLQCILGPTNTLVEHAPLVQRYFFCFFMAKRFHALNRPTAGQGLSSGVYELSATHVGCIWYEYILRTLLGKYGCKLIYLEALKLAQSLVSNPFILHHSSSIRSVFLAFLCSTGNFVVFSAESHRKSQCVI